MRSYPQRRLLRCTALFGAALVAVAGCGSSGQPATSSTTTTPATTSISAPNSEPQPLPAEPTPPGSVGVSPGGVTTKVDVPADATESQYGQACHTAKMWMDEQGGDPQALVEPYLKVLQAPGASGPGTFNTPWAQLTPAQQAGVIIAVTGAANGDCA
jgi:Putative lipoprotein LpqV